MVHSHAHTNLRPNYEKKAVQKMFYSTGDNTVVEKTVNFDRQIQIDISQLNSQSPRKKRRAS